MDTKIAKLMVEWGRITGAQVVSYQEFGQGWRIEFLGEMGNETAALETARGGVREFRTLDAAAGLLAGLGIKAFGVVQ